MADTKGGETMNEQQFSNAYNLGEQEQENEYEMKVEFLDDEGHLLDIEHMTITATSSDDAREKLDAEILENIDLCASDEFDMILIDVH
jgi:hypothetical protein